MTSPDQSSSSVCAPWAYLPQVQIEVKSGRMMKCSSLATPPRCPGLQPACSVPLSPFQCHSEVSGGWMRFLLVHDTPSWYETHVLALHFLVLPDTKSGASQSRSRHLHPVFVILSPLLLMMMSSLSTLSRGCDAPLFYVVKASLKMIRWR